MQVHELPSQCSMMPVALPVKDPTAQALRADVAVTLARDPIAGLGTSLLRPAPEYTGSSWVRYITSKRHARLIPATAKPSPSNRTTIPNTCRFSVAQANGSGYGVGHGRNSPSGDLQGSEPSVRVADPSVSSCSSREGRGGRPTKARHVGGPCRESASRARGTGAESALGRLRGAKPR
jgi:hypothetical protein